MNEYGLPFLNQKLQWNNYWLSLSTNEYYILHNRLAEDFLFLLKNQASMSSNIVYDLGCGYGQDSILFAKNDLIVKAIDFSEHALRILEEKIQIHSLSSLSTVNIDLGNGLPFKDNSCRGVYSHLGLHYFHKTVLKIIFHDIYRTLVPEGILVFNVKSDKDPFYGIGRMIEPNMYDNSGHVRHFFNPNLIEELLIGWTIIEIKEYSILPNSNQPYSGQFIKVFAKK